MNKYPILLSSVFIIILCLSATLTYAQTSEQAFMLNEINKVRAKGRLCGRQYMSATAPLTWNKKLKLSALLHARDMAEKHYFSHYSLDGEDIGERLDQLKYPWSFCGENIAKGQKSFKEALIDWIESSEHCTMLMSDDMEEVGVANYQDVWVQNFGTQLNSNKIFSEKK